MLNKTAIEIESKVFNGLVGEGKYESLHTTVNHT